MQLSFCLLIWPFSVNSNCNFLVAQAFLISTPIGEPCWPQLQPFLSTSLWPGLNLAPSQLTWSSVVASFLVSHFLPSPLSVNIRVRMMLLIFLVFKL